jgi:serine/threonine protein kinase
MVDAIRISSKDDIYSKDDAALVSMFARKLSETDTLHGKRNEDGSITLFTKKRGKLNQAWKKITGTAKEERKLAEEAIKCVFGNDFQIQCKASQPMTAHHLRTAIETDALVKEIKTQKEQNSDPVFHPHTDVHAKIQSEFLKEMRNTMRNCPNDADQISQAATLYGEKLADSLKSIFNTLDKQQQFVAEHRGEFKSYLRSRLMLDGEKLLSNPVRQDLFEKFLDESVDALCVNLFERSDVDGEITMAGQRYIRIENNQTFSEAGTGAIEKYRRAAADPNNPQPDDIIIVKQETEQETQGGASGARKRALDELSAQHRANGSKSEHVTRLIGAAVGSDGKLRIAMEFAPYRDLKKFRMRLDAAVEASVLSPEEADNAKLLLFYDMFKGMIALHEQGMTHFDVKSQNIFIGADGKAKYGDFGKTQNTRQKKLTSRPVDNTRLLSPEIIKGERDAKKESAGILAHFREEARGLILTGKKRELRLAEMNNELLWAEQDAPTFKAGQSDDDWALACAGFELFFSSLPFDGQWEEEIGDSIANFAENKAAKISEQLNRTGGLSNGEKNTKLLALFDELLAPKLENRPKKKSDVLDKELSPGGLFFGLDTEENRANIKLAGQW